MESTWLRRGQCFVSLKSWMLGCCSAWCWSVTGNFAELTSIINHWQRACASLAIINRRKPSPNVMNCQPLSFAIIKHHFTPPRLTISNELWHVSTIHLHFSTMTCSYQGIISIYIAGPYRVASINHHQSPILPVGQPSANHLQILSLWLTSSYHC